MQLPPDLKDALPASVIADIDQWWESLTSNQRQEIEEAADITISEHKSISNFEDMDPDDDRFPLYDYIVNHEIRTVGFLADEHKDNFHKIATTYLATLGSDFRHGKRGTVR